MLFQEIKIFFLEILFPKTCAGCGIDGVDVCNKCIKRIEKQTLQKCPKCKKENRTGKFCGEICKKGYHFDQLIVCANYTKDSLLQKLIFKFKYKYSKDIASTLGDILKSQCLELKSIIPKNALIVPVPIHKKKAKKRGFNQAKLLAQNLSQKKVINCLVQKDYRKEQAKLKRSQRLKNLKDSIKVKLEYKDKIQKQKILLIDDIATTCSTLNECSKALKMTGAKYICGMVLARS